MTKQSAFIVCDTLTLLVACRKYIHGFVGVGSRPRDLYCCPKVCDNDSPAMKKLVNDLAWQGKTNRHFLLLPNPTAACALWWDEQDPTCKACGRPVRDH